MHSSTSQSQLEKKDDMKRRGLASPDLGDTLAMTFAVRPSTRRFQAPKKFDYDAFRPGCELHWMLS